MVTNQSDAYLAGRLIQWSLRPHVVPFNEPEYRELIGRYIERSDFRSLVREVADGLGLIILDVTDRGLFLGTQDGSVFSLKPSDFRSGQATADDRLLDGLVQVAIAAALFPRQRDLDEDATDAKPPITVEYVDRVLREVCSAYKQALAGAPDPDTSDVERGLHEAWRVYESRPSVSMTRHGRLSSNSTQGLIERHLEQLVAHGCFTANRQNRVVQYRPTLRYQVLVKELAATKIYRRLRDLREHPAAADASPSARGD